MSRLILIVSRIYSTAILLLAFGVGATGQERPRAVLIDEFGEIPCGDLLGRTDNFIAELMKYPRDTGYVTLPSSRKRPDATKHLIRANAYMRRFDSNRFRIVIDSQPQNRLAQFWRVPQGADFQKLDEVADKPLDTSKPFIFGWADDLGVCPSFIPSDYVDFIKANPGSSGKMIVRGNTWLGRKSLADDFLPNLLSERALSKDRLRISYVHRPRNYVTDIEFWFIPAK
jgi:hypothetical protein